MWGRDRKKEKTLNPVMEKLAIGLATKIKAVQVRWAKIMERLFNRLSRRGKRIALLLFVCGMILLSAHMVAGGLRATKEPSLPTAISMPKNVQQPNISIRADLVFARIQKFKQALDSLSQSDDGRRKREQFLKGRPGLMDSIRMVEKYYEQYKK